MANQVVIFQLQDQLYGVDIEEVKEIIHMKEITSIPNSSKHVEGVIQLRENLCSVVNGRTLLGLDKKERYEEDKIIVLDGGKIGVIVDQVTEILSVETNDKQKIDELQGLQSLKFIKYLVERDYGIISVLGIKEMLVPKPNVQ